jgi:hypothetical protein
VIGFCRDGRPLPAGRDDEAKGGGSGPESRDPKPQINKPRDMYVARLAYRHAEGEGEEFSLVNASCTLCLPLNSSERFCLLQSRAPSISQVDKGVQYLQQFLRVLKTQREIPISLPLNHASHPRW